MSYFVEYKQAVYAWAICTLLTLVTSQGVHSSLSGSEVYAWHLLGVVIVALSMALLVFFTDGIKTKKSGQQLQLSTWGYIWRYAVCLYLGLIVSAVIMHLVPVINTFIFGSLFMLFFYALFAFLFFCKAKKEKFLVLISLVHGY